MSVIEYRNLLFEVSEKIDWLTERRRLLYICKIFLPDGSENIIQDALSLLNKLEEENHLGIDHLEVLKDLLKRRAKWNLLEIVEHFEIRRREYKDLLEQVGRELDDCNQLQRLISFCEGKIAPDREADIRDVCTLFTELEECNSLGIGRLEILKTMAIEMEKPDLLKQVEEFEKKRKQEEDAERERNKLQESRRRIKGQAAAIWTSARYAGGTLIGAVTPHCTFRNVVGGAVVVTTCMILRRSSSLEQFVNTFTEAVLPLGNTLRAISEGSLCFTVQAENSSALEALWERYHDGVLQRNLQQFLVTEEIKQLADGEVTVTVQIDEQEYKNAFLDLMIMEKNETKVEEEGNRRLKDRTKSDSELYRHSRVEETVLESREDVLQDFELNFFIRKAFVEKYVKNLPETYSTITETSDSGLWSRSAPSEPGFDIDRGNIEDELKSADERLESISKKLDSLLATQTEATREDVRDKLELEQLIETMTMITEKLTTLKEATQNEENIQEKLKRVDEGIKNVSEKMELILTEPREVARYEVEAKKIDLVRLKDSIQVGKQEVRHIMERLDTLRASEEKTKREGSTESGLTKRIWRALKNMKKALDVPKAGRKEMLPSKSKDREDFNYDAYIIHSSKDTEWVFGILLPILEDRHGFKCAFELRDFVPGNGIMDNIVDAITNSRNVIIVISHNLVESNWGKFSSDLAMSEQVERGRNSVIAIRIDSVDSSKFPSGLKRKDVIDYSSLDVSQKWCKKVIKILEGN